MDQNRGSGSVEELVFYGLHTPMPGGSTYDIKWDDEVITVNLPPVGYTIDRTPDPKTGKQSRKIIPCEILNAELPIPDQKWKRVPLPKEWKKWRKQEKVNNRTDPYYVHPEAEKFRIMNWTRRINGCWMALGNRNGKPTEYYYLPGPYWHLLSWWEQDFGHLEFRVSNWEVYLGLCYTYDLEECIGLSFTGNRRGSKTTISMHHLFEYPSRIKNGFGGMQAQTKNDAKKKFTESLVYGFKRQPDFFKPKHDKTNQFKTNISFTPRAKSSNANDDDEEDFSYLGGTIDYRETKSGSYDGFKLHRDSFEEPGKWEEEDVDTTLNVITPCLKDGDDIIGKTFMPTTIEDIGAGGAQFIKIMEDSRPSIWRAKGRTATGMLSMYQPAYKNYIFDEYGRAVIDDPAPNEIVISNKGKRILKGAKTRLLELREAKRHNYSDYVQEIRKYSFTWDEAKMMDTSQSPFNVDILEKRRAKLHGMRSMPYVMGNFHWVGEEDGDVEFVRDDIAGRWALHLNPDRYGHYFDGDKRITNRVGFEMYDGKKMWFPKNSKLFRIGTDPIRYNKTDDPRASKAGAHVWYPFDPSVDFKKPIDEWVSHNFIAQYLVRPDEFEIYGEDMIMACRYFGCHILPEPNVTNLEQHFISRNYGRFLLYRGNFDDTQVQKKNVNDNSKGLDSTDYMVDAYVRRLISFVNRHGHRIHFPDLCEQMIKFTIKDRTKFDCVVSAGYAITAGDASVEEYIDEGNNENNTEIFSLYDSGSGKEVHIDNDEVPDFFERV